MEGLGAGDGAIFFKVGFIADDDKGDKRVILDSNDLVAEFVEFGEGGQRGDAEDEEEALTGFHIEFSVYWREIRVECEERLGVEKSVPHGSCGCVSLNISRMGEWWTH